MASTSQREDAGLCQMSAAALGAAIGARSLSPVEVAEAVLRRIDAVNPVLNALVTVTADRALADARGAEARALRGDRRGPLDGVPYSLKDLTATRGIRTTMGSKLFEHHVPDEDALVAERLRAAGGVLLGKTNTPDHGCKGVTDNVVFGATRNPWALDRTPGGSSGGAAAAVAAGLGPLAEGSDFAGSVRIPAAHCGVVGMKPSEGRIPLHPNPTIWHPVASTHGPLARTVEDAALLLQAMAGPDPRDPRSLPDTGEDFVAAARRPHARGLRCAWLSELGGVPVEPGVRELCARASGAFADLGCELEEAALDLGEAAEAYALLNACRRAAILDAYDPARRGQLDPQLVWRAELARGRSATDVGRAEIVQSALYQRLRRLFDRHDLLLLPTVSTPPHPIGVDFPSEVAGAAIETPFQLLPLTFTFNLSGHPAISVPAGWTPEGLPVGLQIVGGWRRDAVLLQAAAAYEEAVPWADRWPTP